MTNTSRQTPWDAFAKGVFLAPPLSAASPAQNESFHGAPNTAASLKLAQTRRSGAGIRALADFRGDVASLRKVRVQSDLLSSFPSFMNNLGMRGSLAFA